MCLAYHYPETKVTICILPVGSVCTSSVNIGKNLSESLPTQKDLTVTEILRLFLYDFFQKDVFLAVSSGLKFASWK